MTKKQKREAKENVLLEKALSVMATPSTAITQLQETEDDDLLFCRFIASELRSISDIQVKRMVKWKIQSAVFFAASSPPEIFSPHNERMAFHQTIPPASPAPSYMSSNSSFNLDYTNMQ